MKTQRSNLKWISFCMVAMSAAAFACEGSSSDAEPPMSGAGGASGGEGGSPSQHAAGSSGEGGSPSDGGSGGEGEGQGGNGGENEGGSGGEGSDTDVEWHSVAMGSFPGGDGTATPCDDVQAVLLHDKAELDQWAIDQGIGNLESESIVDWTTQIALGAVTLCSTSGHKLESGNLTPDESGGLTVELTVTDVVPTFSVATTVWSVYSVEGREWTDVSATTTIE